MLTASLPVVLMFSGGHWECRDFCFLPSISALFPSLFYSLVLHSEEDTACSFPIPALARLKPMRPHLFVVLPAPSVAIAPKVTGFVAPLFVPPKAAPSTITPTITPMSACSGCSPAAGRYSAGIHGWGSTRLSGGRGVQGNRTGGVRGPGPGGMAKLSWSPSSDPMRGLALPRPATGALAFTLQL